MRYLKNFKEKYLKSRKSDEEIHQVCEQYNITKYIINSDGSIDVDAPVNLSNLGLTELPIQFRIVTDKFLCDNNRLTTLKGAPLVIYGYKPVFDCSNNELTNLNYGPKSKCYYYCNSNELTTLEGSPDESSFFDCSNNNLSTLKGCPKFIRNSDFVCSNNKLTDLEDGPEYIRGNYVCLNNKITEYPKNVILFGDLVTDNRLHCEF